MASIPSSRPYIACPSGVKAKRTAKEPKDGRSRTEGTSTGALPALGHRQNSIVEGQKQRKVVRQFQVNDVIILPTPKKGGGGGGGDATSSQRRNEKLETSKEEETDGGTTGKAGSGRFFSFDLKCSSNVQIREQQ